MADKTPAAMKKAREAYWDMVKETGIGHYTRKTKFMARALGIFLVMDPEEIKAYKPLNGLELVAKNLILAEGRDGQIHIQKFKEIKETLGERVGSNWKDTVEEKQKKNAAVIVNTVPYAQLPPLQAEAEDEESLEN